jgi:hypothetical protein
VALGTLTKSGRANRFSTTATDAAGNAGTRTITVTVVKTRKTKS